MQKIWLISKKFNEILRFENFETTLTNVKFHKSLHLCKNLCHPCGVCHKFESDLCVSAPHVCISAPSLCISLPPPPFPFLCPPSGGTEKLYVRLSVPPPLFFIIPLCLSPLQVKSLHGKLRFGWCAHLPQMCCDF